jgi:hypothetical protein
MAIGRPPDITTKDLIQAARVALVEADGIVPDARAVRRAAEDRGSTLRCTHAILAVQIERGMTPHLFSTLPPDFQAEITVPVAAAVATSAQGPFTLPFVKEKLAEIGIFLSVQLEKEVKSLREKREQEHGEWVSSTGQLQTSANDLAGEVDRLDDEAKTTAAQHTSALAKQNERIVLLEATVKFKDERIASLITDHEKALTSSRDEFKKTEARLESERDEAKRDLQTERDACRKAERECSALTERVDALTKDNARLELEAAARRTAVMLVSTEQPVTG